MCKNTTTTNLTCIRHALIKRSVWCDLYIHTHRKGNERKMKFSLLVCVCVIVGIVLKYFLYLLIYLFQISLHVSCILMRNCQMRFERGIITPKKIQFANILHILWNKSSLSIDIKFNEFADLIISTQYLNKIMMALTRLNKKKKTTTNESNLNIFPAHISIYLMLSIHNDKPHQQQQQQQ